MESGNKDKNEMMVNMFLNTSEYLQFLLSELSLIPPDTIPQSVKQVTLDLLDSVQKMMKNMQVSQAREGDLYKSGGWAPQEYVLSKPSQQHPYLDVNPRTLPRRPHNAPFSPPLLNMPQNNQLYFVVPTQQPGFHNPSMFQENQLNHPLMNPSSHVVLHDTTLQQSPSNLYNVQFQASQPVPSKSTSQWQSCNPNPPPSHFANSQSNSCNPNPPPSHFANSESNSSNPTPRSSHPPSPFPNGKLNASSCNPTPRSTPPPSHLANSQSNSSNPTPRSTPPPSPFPNGKLNTSSCNPTPRSTPPPSQSSSLNHSRRGSTSSNSSFVSNASSKPQFNKPHQKSKTRTKKTRAQVNRGEIIDVYVGETVAPKEEAVAAPKEETQTASALVKLDQSDPHYMFKFLLEQMGSYLKKTGSKLPAMFCFVCHLPFDSFFDWMEHIESPNHQVADYVQRRCDTCMLEMFGLSRDINSFLQFPEHKVVDQLYFK